ncbi:hypothetical protein Glove_707g77 [Diversispora epigaea]|uniref:Uncharacterized protein n=1 Tax=Diversispora epigaea TaxID=1348612 RepID=A0A397G1J5_9GLOM|nr:hypothetical protein Glove_707g77 [Diversispora epigaea]
MECKQCLDNNIDCYARKILSLQSDFMEKNHDVLLREGIENNGIDCGKIICTENMALFNDWLICLRFIFNIGFFYNVYAMDWKARDIWRLVCQGFQRHAGGYRWGYVTQ